MEYPFVEKIGPPELLVGRADYFQNFGEWIDGIPHQQSSSRAIIARRRSGKTVFAQRLFNDLWVANGPVIPLYYEFDGHKMWYPSFAMFYFIKFASQYISFIERDPTLVRASWELNSIYEYGKAQSHPLLAQDAAMMMDSHKQRNHDEIWRIASHMPHTYATALNTQFLVILDEFPFLESMVYADPYLQTGPMETIVQSLYKLAVSKFAPMLITIPSLHWFTKFTAQYKPEQFEPWYLPSYLTPEEGLQAVHTYATMHGIPVSDEAAALINEACLYDPFLISNVIQSNYPQRDLATANGIANTVAYELTHRRTEMFLTWGNYIHKALDAIYDIAIKQALLFLSKHNDQAWSIPDLKAKLTMSLSEEEIHHKLYRLVEADILEQRETDEGTCFRGVQDGSLHIILWHRFEEEVRNAGLWIGDRE